MRLKNALLLAAMISTLSAQLSAEEHTMAVKKRTMQISTNGISIFFGSLGLSYYLGLNNTFALGLHGNGTFFSILDTMSITGGGGGLSTKIFLSGDAFTDSWYLEPSLLFSFTQIKIDNAFLKTWNINPSLIAGYTWVWSKGITLSLGFGARYNHMFADQNVVNAKLGMAFKGFTPTGDLSLGWAW